jgi:hypothetical protein
VAVITLYLPIDGVSFGVKHLTFSPEWVLFRQNWPLVAVRKWVKMGQKAQIEIVEKLQLYSNTHRAVFGSHAGADCPQSVRVAFAG